MTEFMFREGRYTNFKEGQVYIVEYNGDSRIVKKDSEGLVLVDQEGSVTAKSLSTTMCRYALIKDVEPPTFGQLSDEEKGALLLAWYEGKTIQFFSRFIAGQGETRKWRNQSAPIFFDSDSYRIKPEPEVTSVVWWIRGNQSVSVAQCSDTTHKISYNILDGVIDCSSVKLEAIE